MVYESLVKYQADGTIAPWLATAWTHSADGKKWTFTLRENVTFSNGEPFNAEAARANFMAVLANRQRHAWLELANQIVAVNALDDRHLQIELKDAYYPFLQELALPRPFRFIAPSQFKEGGTKNGIIAPVGTGPWILKESKLNQYDVFVRNEHYWGEKPAVENVTVKVIADPTSRAVAFETGEIDLMYGDEGLLPLDTFERFSHNPQYKTQLSAPVETVMLALNSAKSPTREQAVREALNHAVDKKTLINSVLYGTQQVDARQRDGRFDMIFNRTWGAPFDPHAFMSSMRVPSHADYQAQRGLPDKVQIDAEIGQILTGTDEKQRQALFRDVLTRLHQSAVYLPLSYVSLMTVSQPQWGTLPFAPMSSDIPFEQIKPVTP